MATHLTNFHIILLAFAYGSCFGQNIRKELRTKDVNQEKIIRLSHPVKPNSIDPSQVVQLSWQPRVFLYKGFLSEDECDYLISWVHGKKRYTMRSDDSPKINTSKVPYNYSVPVDADDEIVRRIEERISAWTFLPKENSKSLSILHFAAEDSENNYNYFGNESTAQVGQPLLATVILYLSNVSQGGPIVFPQSKNHVLSDCAKNSNIFRPIRGNAIVFFNLHLNATLDTTSIHARCPVTEGDMWCATKFFYLKNISIEKGQLQSDNASCTDEDENCAGWAAIGECERNSIFMVGSPDYYGTCRKSCSAC